MDNKKFQYKYFPSEKQEIEEIRKKYQCSEEESLAQQIKALDKKADTEGTICSIIFGIVSTLVFGFGLTLCLTFNSYYAGCIVGVIGLVGMGTTPFLDDKLKKYYKKRVSKKIVELCDKYLNSGNQ